MTMLKSDPKQVPPTLQHVQKSKEDQEKQDDTSFHPPKKIQRLCGHANPQPPTPKKNNQTTNWFDTWWRLSRATRRNLGKQIHRWAPPQTTHILKGIKRIIKGISEKGMGHGTWSVQPKNNQGCSDLILVIQRTNHHIWAANYYNSRTWMIRAFWGHFPF